MPATISSTTDGSRRLGLEAEQERRGERDRGDEQEVVEHQAGLSCGRAEQRAERAAPDPDLLVARLEVARDVVLLVALVALERAEVDVADADAQVGAGVGLEVR